jgi:tagatose-1,6-bisphosphate aldolase non-catalytic subunit AgaZ/GatZ
LVSQYLPRQYDRIADGSLAPRCEDVARDAVRLALDPYVAASAPHPFSAKEA